MKLLDFPGLNWSATNNFINHPPLGYHLLGLGDFCAAPSQCLRVVSTSVFSAGFGLILIGFHATERFSGFALLVVTVICLALKLHNFAPVFGNDSIAFFGGSLACLGSVLAWREDGRARMTGGAALILLGYALAAAAKLNAALLVGLYCLTHIALLMKSGRLDFKALFSPSIAVGAMAATLASAQYVWLYSTYGSPAPETPGQIQMISANAGTGARMAFGQYVAESMKAALSNAGPDAFYSYAFFAACLVAALVWILVWKRARAGEKAIAAAFGLSFALTAIVHLVFSYQRHLDYGWQVEFYPRYYFPLLGPAMICCMGSLLALRVFSALRWDRRAGLD